MKLALGLIYYQGKPELKLLLDSLPYNNGPYFIIAIDCILKYTYEQNKELQLLSNDGSTELLRSYRHAEVKIIHAGNRTEHEKRNRYLEMCEKLDIDYLIICDSDEYFIYEDLDCSCIRKRAKLWTRFRNNFEREAQYYNGHQNVFNIQMFDPRTNVKQDRPRCWYKPGEMRYLHRSHYHYGNVVRDKEAIDWAIKQGRTYLQYSKSSIKDGNIILANDLSLRNATELERREKYQRYLVNYEALVQTDQRLEDDRVHRMAMVQSAQQQ